jgi:predicted hexulose-6-phosphate isomerase
MKEYALALYEKALPPAEDLALLCRRARAGGFDRLELSIDETEPRLARLDWPEKAQRDLGLRAREEGAPIRTLCLSGHRKYPLGARDPETRKRSLEILKKAIAFASNAGISIIQLAGYDVYYEPGDEGTRARFRDGLLQGAAWAAEAGVVLAFETMETPFMDTVEKALAWVREVDSPWLGLYPDIGNLQNAAAKYGHSVTADLALGAGHVFALHLKETRPGVYRDLRFGSGGHTDYDGCLRTAWSMGVRSFTGEFWYHGEEDWEAEVRRASAFLREKIEKAAEEG